MQGMTGEYGTFVEELQGRPATVKVRQQPAQALPAIMFVLQ